MNAVATIFNLFAIDMFEKVCDFENSSLDSIQWIRFCILQNWKINKLVYSITADFIGCGKYEIHQSRI